MDSKEDSIDGSFDIDVVGFTDLNNYKSEGELFDFESSADYGLFGEKDFYTFGTSSKTLVSSEKKQKKQNNASLSNKKKRRSKDWNEAEKGLFLTGLEMFGENWKKISKFIATKTPYQVKIYHQLHSETANDSSYYLPVIPEDNNICLGLNQTRNDDFVNEKFNSGDDRLSSSSRTMSIVNNLVIYSSEAAIDEASASKSVAKHNCGDELFVSPLHDWSLGSQVSVIEEIPSFNSQDEQNYFQSNASYLKCTSMSPPMSNVKLVSNNNKNKKNSKLIKSGKKVAGLKKQSGKVSASSGTVFDGEVIRMSKGNDVDGDIDIVGSDNEESKDDLEDCHVDIGYIVEECNKKRPMSSSETKFIKMDHPLEALTSIEGDFCKNKIGLDKVNSFISAKLYITKLWNERKAGSRLTLSLVLHGSEHCNINNKDMSKIFNFLEKQELINCKSEGSAHSKRNSKNIEKIRKKFSSKMYRQLGGGVTMSHNSSGIVTKAVHVPESHKDQQPSCKKSKVDSNVIKLLNCLKYENGRNPPFTTVIHPTALILLDIHAHSSYSEVMGLLGGYLDVDDAILHIITVVATKAISSTIDCDMCPFDQKNALQMIHEAGSEVVGWYHSHPTFLPNPSKRDLETQTQLHDYFQKQGSPFIGLIISPFCTSVFSGASIIRCIILDKHILGSHTKIVGSHSLSPFDLPLKICDLYEIEYDDIESSVIKLLVKIDSHPNSVKWCKEYLNGVSFSNKLCQSLLTHIPSNLKSTIHLVKNTLCANL